MTTLLFIWLFFALMIGRRRRRSQTVVVNYQPQTLVIVQVEAMRPMTGQLLDQ